MAGVKGQGRDNGSALRHGQKSLLSLVQSSQDESHPVLQIIRAKAQEYAVDRGGTETLSTMERDTLRHAATLSILADMHVHRIISERGKPRRMSALKFRDLALAFARIVESHNRLVASVGLERRARPVDDPRALAAFIQSLPVNEAPKGDATP